MAKFGIYLGYAPEQKLNDQGLGRLLTFILKGVINNNTHSRIPIAMPKWYEDTFLELIYEHDIDLDNIEIITTDYIPLIFRIREKLRERKFGFFSRIKVKFLPVKFRLANEFFNIISGGWSFNKLITISALIISISAILGILLMPVFITAILLFIGMKGVKRITRRYHSTVFSLLDRYKSNGKDIKNDKLVQKIFERIRDQELFKLAQKLNSRQDIENWFVPTLFWPEIKYLQGRKVVTVPDIVFYDFPVEFRDEYWIKALDRVENTMATADKFICYSEYVKNNHICKRFGVASTDVDVIQHGHVDMSNLLTGTSSEEILKSYIKEYYESDDYLNGFPLHDCDYILYASQCRPHKNILALLKAYKIILRERFIPIKLVLTGRVYDDDIIADFIDSNGLHCDVISLTDVPTKVLAALNKHAICHVNPTLFEGGFPFTFSEAYSVGTPSVMSRIPMVKEIVKEYDDYPNMFFEPTSIASIVDCVSWVINNRDLALELQEPLYENFKRRTWDIVANEYIKSIER
ncbi:glycosyltransferase [Vibrio ordalii]|uniref:glycosyltransferase n=1 Tax=Vibrio ordalii TaxID=28174 RepID=UPI0002F8C323|nr:glycosyltransferase [Vibrio ordalii]OEE76863.1 hypothetical protein A1QQ_02845 [Vibrio ordalii FF-167]